MIPILSETLEHALIISVFVFCMMVFIDYFNVLTRGRMSKVVKGNKFQQYVITSFLGATPGCLGAFMNVSFYIRGLITFGAIVGGMVATSGDAAFIMLAMFPKTALLLFGLLFVLGIGIAWITDKITPLLGIKPCDDCKLATIHKEDDCVCFDGKHILANLKKPSFSRLLMVLVALLSIYAVLSGLIGPDPWNFMNYTFLLLFLLLLAILVTVPEHYLKEHLWEHVFKKHLGKIFLWSFFALLVVGVGLQYWNLEAFIAQNMLWVLVIAALVALIPESGPHLIFVMMFAEGIIPFSVLLTSSIVQDGHGMLPLLSYSVKDSVWVKVINVFFGLLIGGMLYFVGL
ncbi:putative manganese transporter [Candidatus Undinarchaeota archaeon]